jgi:hypothetical protein
MTIQKFITYTPLDINGKQLDSKHELKLNVLENQEIIYYIKIF